MVPLFQLCFHFLIFYKLGSCRPLSSDVPTNLSTKTDHKPLPIETTFKLPSLLPTWPPGEGFGSGSIDLGGLEVIQITSFRKVWTNHEGGPDNLGATFFEPFPIPEGFFVLGSYAQPNNSPLFGWALVAKDHSGGILKEPIDYKLVWSSESSSINRDGDGYIWLPKPPKGYKSMGHVVTNSSQKPSLGKIRCVLSDFTGSSKADGWIWGHDKEIKVHSLKPTRKGIKARGVSAGTFIAQNDTKSIACLKNVRHSLSSIMPNLSQINALFQAYSPWIYFHPDEPYFPSSVSWFFKNGALLYKKGEEIKLVSASLSYKNWALLCKITTESNHISNIDPIGSNLPKGGLRNDGAYWLDLPIDEAAKEMVKKGNLQDAGVYLNVKPMLGGTFTDIVIWLFYPFNGPGTVKIAFFSIGFGRIGEHVGDWEHVTLRISNFNGELRSVYFSEHKGGMWVSSSELEFQGGNKPVTYASLHGHAFYPKPGLMLRGILGIGARDDTARGEVFMDTGLRFMVAGAEYLGPAIVEPPWLNYTRKWGPTITYRIADKLKKVGKFLPGLVRTGFHWLMSGLPSELFGEEGPTGPKAKKNWCGDES